MATKLKVGKRIGSGHFSNVHAGTDPVHGKVAVKVLKRHRSESDADWAERQRAVLAEGRHLSTAQHDHVVRVFYVEDSPTGPRLVMELCAGGSVLKQYKVGPMRLADVRKVATEISFGLGEVHSKSMLHRDIKPANILLDERGRAKLGDFGHVTDRIVVGYASAAGYSDHLAKEVHDTGQTSQRSDVWALGMTLYRLLHGKAWYDERPGVTALMVQAGGYAKRLRWLPHIPAEWQRFIRKAMHDDPRKRFRNSVEFRNGLARLPVIPDWTCTVSSDALRWERQHRGKQQVVEWNRARGRRAWTAKSIDPTSGKTHTLRTSKSLRELQAFLCRPT